MEEESRRFPRWSSALFPLVAIVLLVYLASQTLLAPGEERARLPYSDAKELVRDSPGEIEIVVFEPRSQRLEIDLRDGRRYESNYPSDASQLALEEELEEAGVRHDARASGDSAWWSFLTYLLPFVLFFGFWIFLMNRMKRGRGDDSA